jgi:hypothetical protein
VQLGGICGDAALLDTVRCARLRADDADVCAVDERFRNIFVYDAIEGCRGIFRKQNLIILRGLANM